MPDLACIAFKISQAVYLPLFKTVWGDDPSTIHFPSNTAVICSTPGGAAQFGSNPSPIALSAGDRTKANNVYDHWGQSISFLESSDDISPFTSKFDAFLAGNYTLTSGEMAGYNNLFRGKGNCNSCHLDGRSTAPSPTAPGADDNGTAASTEPLFTCFGYANLGLPKNPRDAFYYQTTPDSFGFTPNPGGFTYTDYGLGTFLRSGFGSGPNPNGTWRQFAAKSDGQFQTSTARDVALVPSKCPTTEAPGPYFQKANKTVIRGGYGIYYAPVTMNGFQANSNYGFSTNPLVTDLTNGRQAAFSLDSGFPQSAVQLPPQISPTLANGTNVLYMNPNGIKLPRYQDWTFSVQRQITNSLLVDIAYIGNHGTRLISPSNMSDLNQNNPLILQQYPLSELTAQVGTPAANGFPAPYPGFVGTVAQASRPYPQYQSVPQFNGANGSSIYHSLQVTLDRRFSNGLQLNAGYVYSKLINNGAESGLNSGFQGASPISTFLPTRAVSIDNVPNVATITFLYSLPFGSGKTFLNHGGWTNWVLGGWNVAGNLRYESGRPLAIYIGANQYSGVLFNTSQLPDRVAGVSGYVDTNNSNFDIVNNRYITSAVFPNPAPLSLGNESRVDSVLRGWANYNENISLFKDFPVYKERVAWRLGANASNLFNRHQWCDPDTNLSDGANFGAVTGQCNLPRAIQLYTKITF